MTNYPKSSQWLGLMIGNSRLHWAFFAGDSLKRRWDSQHRQIPLVEKQLPEDILPLPTENIPLYIASVVPSQTEIWQDYLYSKIITLEDIPLHNLYKTLGIDRALAALGAGETYGFPCLVIDAGTALTFTGVNTERVFIGGAILPGLGLQLQTLGAKTAALPDVTLPDRLPIRWGLNTPEAILSGVIYTLLAGVRDFIESWWTEFPDTEIVITGGDGHSLKNYLQSQVFEITQNATEIRQKVTVDPNLIFWGMRALL